MRNYARLKHLLAILKVRPRIRSDFCAHSGAPQILPAGKLLVASVVSWLQTTTCGQQVAGMAHPSGLLAGPDRIKLCNSFSTCSLMENKNSPPKVVNSFPPHHFGDRLCILSTSLGRNLRKKKTTKSYLVRQRASLRRRIWL